jgi:hypothetical protein
MAAQRAGTGRVQSVHRAGEVHQRDVAELLDELLDLGGGATLLIGRAVQARPVGVGPVLALALEQPLVSSRVMIVM